MCTFSHRTFWSKLCRNRLKRNLEKVWAMPIAPQMIEPAHELLEGDNLRHHVRPRGRREEIHPRLACFQVQ